jgi:flavin-dependent dehydrogenase
VRQAVLAAGFHRHRGVWIERDGTRQFEPYGEDENGPWLGFQADREQLHLILLSAVVASGASLIRPAAPARVIKRGNQVAGVEVSGIEYLARFTADATGRRAWLANTLSLEAERHSPALWVRFGWSTEETPHLEGQPIFCMHSSGWDWRAPLSGGQIAWATMRIERAADSGPIPGSHGINFAWRTHRPSAGPGYFLLGDAAVLLDPASSDGVLRALMSGILAGHLINEVLQGRLSEKHAQECYTSWFENLFKHHVDRFRPWYSPMFRLGLQRSS